jgi:exosortase
MTGSDRGGHEPLLWLGVGAAFVPAVLALAERWASAEYYQHGFLVPLVSIATAHPRLRGIGPPVRWAPGLAALAGALAVYAVGVLMASVPLQGLALVGAVTALVARAWGPSGVRRLAFPLGFLLFMVPLPETWVNPVIVGLQMLASAGAVEVLQALGASVLREGNVIRLPGGESLFVAEACSGITSLLSLIPIGVLLARFGQRGVWRRALLVASVVPAALLGNAVRVILTVWLAQSYGAQRATSGALHESAGLLTSAFAVLLVMAFGALLARTAPRSSSSGAAG